MRDLRSRPRPAALVPAVAVTSESNIDVRARALAAGYDLHVVSPLDPSQLITASAAVLRAG